MTALCFGRTFFAVSMIASGALNLVVRNFYSAWLPAPAWLPAGSAVVFGAVLVLAGAGLLVRRSAARVLLAALVLFLAVVKVPVVLAAPADELRWLGFGQITVLATGAWSLLAPSRAARVVTGLALLPIGLSHFFYLKIATTMVPAVLPFRPEWVIFTGVAHCAAGLALMAGVQVRLAAILEAGMVTAFAALVWLGPVLAAPSNPKPWMPFLITVAVAGGLWAVALSGPSEK